ncbi:hypothetical protein SARC_03906 [Sphaeroforma arctica JP610]|uniref:Uncharacterized protein n=1 Tax=Sphaeroforma arctica JP610 TaxID=667725 RepID=A0A0L0G4M1_9EUKA|nr:hypothetical protein SARC_03906 [Sphaeroforma arctica JP610]KNC83849.1 hypothetical protein SARC_03906 [Sphaeroforma arctica JP610]|eukprot:XP_014157751.1 hypothetical protein SARC_03906 [Sphaeroforma arctica JP610]
MLLIVVVRKTSGLATLADGFVAGSLNIYIYFHATTKQEDIAVCQTIRELLCVGGGVKDDDAEGEGLTDGVALLVAVGSTHAVYSSSRVTSISTSPSLIEIVQSLN